MTSRGKRKPRYGFDEIVMPRRLPRTGTRRQADNAGRGGRVRHVVMPDSTVLPGRVPLKWLADSMVGMINRNTLRRSPSGRQGLGDFFESTAFGVYAEAELD